MKSALIIAVLLVLPSTGRADQTIYRCDGMLTSNNVCIGSESNVDSTDDHEPIHGSTFYTKPEPRRDHRPEPVERNRDDDSR